MKLNRMSSVFRFDRHQQFSFLEPKNNDKSEYQVTKINPASSPQLTHDCHDCHCPRLAIQVQQIGSTPP